MHSNFFENRNGIFIGTDQIHFVQLFDYRSITDFMFKIPFCISTSETKTVLFFVIDFYLAVKNKTIRATLGIVPNVFNKKVSLFVTIPN